MMLYNAIQRSGKSKRQAFVLYYTGLTTTVHRSLSARVCGLPTLPGAQSRRGLNTFAASCPPREGRGLFCVLGGVA